MTSPILSQIKPEYQHKVKYSKPEEPLQEVQDCQPFNASRAVADKPIRRVDAGQDAAWARELREASSV